MGGERLQDISKALSLQHGLRSRNLHTTVQREAALGEVEAWGMGLRIFKCLTISENSTTQSCALILGSGSVCPQALPPDTWDSLGASCSEGVFLFRGERSGATGWWSVIMESPFPARTLVRFPPWGRSHGKSIRLRIGDLKEVSSLWTSVSSSAKWVEQSPTYKWCCEAYVAVNAEALCNCRVARTHEQR